MTIQNKKSSIILVLKVLQEYSDWDHYLTYQAIIDKVYSNYGIELERKSVAYSIELLKDLGYQIDKQRPDGVALLVRQFDPGDVRFLIDAVFSSKAIPAEDAKLLSEKIQQGLSVYMRKDYGYVVKGKDLSRSENSQALKNIELINEAISKGRCVSFTLLDFNRHCEPILKENGKRHVVSPYFIVNNLGRIYLLGHQRDSTIKMKRYRVDRIIAAEIETHEEYTPSCQVLGDDFSISKFLDEHIYLLDGEVVDALIRIEDHIEGRPGSRVGEGIRFLHDWFGKRAKIFEKPEDGQVYARVRCDASSLFYWIMQYSEEFTLIESKERAEEIRDYLRIYLTKYDKLLGGSK